MKRNNVKLLVIAVAAASAGLLWWPVSIRGHVMHGDYGTPEAGVQVTVRSSVLRPWALFVLAAGTPIGSDISNPVTISTRTDEKGNFVARVQAGVRFEHAVLQYEKPGMVVRPRAYAGSGRILIDRSDLSTAGDGLVIRAWPAPEILERGELEIPIQSGKSDASIRLGSGDEALFLNLEVGDGKAGVIARWFNGQIRLADEFNEALLAPTDGYGAEVRAKFDCNHRPQFFVRGDSGAYGWLSLQFPVRCRSQGHMFVSYRLNHEPGIRALVGRDEL